MGFAMVPFIEKCLSRRSNAIAAVAFAVTVACCGCGVFRGGDGDYEDGDAYEGGLDSLLGGFMPPMAIPGANAAKAGKAEPARAVATQGATVAPESPAEGVGESPAEGVGETEPAAEPMAAEDDGFESGGDAGTGPGDAGFDPLPFAVVPDGVIPKLGEDGEPLLRTGLTISVAVLVADKVEVPTQVRLISPENTVQLPFVGIVSCDGMTLNQFNAKLSDLYGEYLHDPIIRTEFVTTGDAESPWGKVRVMGHVGREGWINIPPTRDLSLLSALQRAGGVAKGAKRTRVRITRNLPDGTKKVFSSDLDKMGKDGDEAQDIPLEPGDTVWVDERVW